MDLVSFVAHLHFGRVRVHKSISQNQNFHATLVEAAAASRGESNPGNKATNGPMTCSYASGSDQLEQKRSPGLRPGLSSCLVWIQKHPSSNQNTTPIFFSKKWKVSVAKPCAPSEP